MIQDIRNLQSKIESDFLQQQPYVESAAVELSIKDPELMTRYLTDYSVTHGEMVIKRWRKLGEYLIWKYNDGFVKNEGGNAEDKGYPEDWLREVVKNRPDQFLLDGNE